jgi:hypothetical protein
LHTLQSLCQLSQSWLCRAVRCVSCNL